MSYWFVIIVIIITESKNTNLGPKNKRETQRFYSYLNKPRDKNNVIIIEAKSSLLEWKLIIKTKASQKCNGQQLSSSNQKVDRKHISL